MGGREGRDRAGSSVPRFLLTASEIAWRVLVVLAALAAIVFLLAQVRIVVIPFGIALLIAGILGPPASWLKARGVPAFLATWLVMLSWLGVAGMAIWFASTGLAGQFADIGDTLSRGWDSAVEWIRSTPLSSLAGGLSSLSAQLGERGDRLGTWLVSGAATAVEVATMTVLTLLFTFYLVKDGERLFGVFVRQLDRGGARVAQEAGETMWRTLSRYFAGLAVIATFNALLTGVALWLIGVPLIFVLMVVTFVGSFIPLVGPVVAAILGALVALTAGSALDALLVLLAGFVIQQIEGNALEPVVMGRVMHVHPIGVIAAVAAGATVAGLPGAFFAVPVVAMSTTLYSHFRDGGG